MVAMFDWIGQRIFRYVHEHNLVYASCWEDPRADLIGMRISETDRVLAITSAGCNALDYLLENPQHVYAVDINYRQNALLELKRAAIATLGWTDFFAIFGKGHHPGAKEIYHDTIRGQLAPEYQPYWDRQIGLFCGSRSFYFRTTSGYFAQLFRYYIDHILRVREPIERLLAATSVEEQIAIYERDLKHRFWGPWLGFALQRDSLLALSGIPPQQRRQVQRFEPNIQAYMQRQAERVIYHLPIRENYFWRVYLTGEFTPEVCPRYLAAANFDQLKSKLIRLTSHTGSVQQFLDSHEVSISKFVLLDHMDWLTGSRAKELAEEWQAIWNNSTPDCRILWRSLGIESDYVDEVALRINGNNVRLCDVLEYDLAAAKRIRDSERVTAYGCTCLAKWQLAGRAGRS
jgi:S-adenosylmethionine-diacylglycerol 3-amino-3-carboxypropyl transferase